MSTEHTTDYDCLHMHPYAMATAQDQHEMEMRELERQQGRVYDEIEFWRTTGEIHSLTVSELLERNPALKTVMDSNRLDRYTLTTATCALIPDVIKEAHHDRPLWVLQCPGKPDESFIDGSCFLGLREQPLHARGEVHAESGLLLHAQLYWFEGKRHVIAVDVHEVIESLEDADKGEGSILIALVGPDTYAIGQSWIPYGFMNWLHEPGAPPFYLEREQQTGETPGDAGHDDHDGERAAWLQDLSDTMDSDAHADKVPADGAFDTNEIITVKRWRAERS
jgi:hypothetical protein